MTPWWLVDVIFVAWSRVPVREISCAIYAKYRRLLWVASWPLRDGAVRIPDVTKKRCFLTWASYLYNLYCSAKQTFFKVSILQSPSVSCWSDWTFVHQLLTGDWKKCPHTGSRCILRRCSAQHLLTERVRKTQQEQQLTPISKLPCCRTLLKKSGAFALSQFSCGMGAVGIRNPIQRSKVLKHSCLLQFNQVCRPNVLFELFAPNQNALDIFSIGCREFVIRSAVGL